MLKREASHLNPIFRIHLQYLMNDLKNKLNRNEKYIIVGDNNIAKSIIARRFNNVHMFNNKIIHLGEKTQFETMNEMSLMDTIIDFCIIRYSRSVVSYSAYGHGSGFSKQCAHIYGVPFDQSILQPSLQTSHFVSLNHSQKKVIKRTRCEMQRVKHKTQNDNERPFHKQIPTPTVQRV